MKQTAVEWLIDQLKDGVKYNPLEIGGYTNAQDKLFEQAKEMEKQHKQEEYLRGYKEGIESGSTYYPD